MAVVTPNDRGKDDKLPRVLHETVEKDKGKILLSKVSNLLFS
jgi:hypothetical protein